MNNPEEIKRILTPVMVARHYLGSPNKSGNRLWYKAPWRNERTASLLVDDISFHDFGENWDGDVISFIERYYNVDFINAMKILSRDFGLPEDEKISRELEEYLKQKREEEQQIKRAVENWYNRTLNKLCTGLHRWNKMLPYLKGEALSIAYNKIQYLDYLIDEFIYATEDEKIELWKDRKNIKKHIE